MSLLLIVLLAPLFEAVVPEERPEFSGNVLACVSRQVLCNFVHAVQSQRSFLESLELQARILTHPVAWLFYPKQSLNILHQQALGDKDAIPEVGWHERPVDRRPPPHAWSHLKGERPLRKPSSSSALFACSTKQGIFAVDDHIRHVESTYLVLST